jgi:ParB-like chromosome segregation protein Spo0J
MKYISLCRVETYLPIEKLKLHPDNPRQISKEKLEALKQSIIDKGFYQPILVWKKGNIILAGNHRYMAVKELVREGYEFNSWTGKEKHVLPVVIEDVTDEMAESILFESNNHYAEWIEEKLAEAIAKAQEAGRDVEGFGFDKEYVDVLLKTALSDAEGIITDRKVEPVDYDEIEGAIGDHDEFESLILPRPVYETAVELLAKVAKGLNKEWSEGDSYAEAMGALCQFAREKGIEELWLKPKSKLRKSKESASLSKAPTKRLDA